MFNSRLFTCASVFALMVLLSPTVNAADFTVTVAGSPDAVAKSLGGSETGTIDTGATLAISGATAIVTAGGISNTITNNGTVSSDAANYVIQITPTGGTTTITNNGTIDATGTGQSVRIVADNNTLTNNSTITTGGTDAIFVNGDNNQIILSSGSTLTGGINFAGGSGNTLEYWTGTSCPQGGGICTVSGSTPTITAGTAGVEYSEVVHALGGGNLAGSTKTVTKDNTTVAVTEDSVRNNNMTETQSITQAGEIATNKVQSAETQSTGASTSSTTTETSSARTRTIAYDGSFGRTLGYASFNYGVFISGENTYSATIDLVQMTEAELTTLFWGIFFESNSLYQEIYYSNPDAIVAKIICVMSMQMLQAITDELDYRKDISEGTQTGMSSGDAYQSELDKMKAALNDRLSKMTPEERSAYEQELSKLTTQQHNSKVYKAWAEVYGSYRERPDYHDSVYSKNKSGGIVAGVNLPQKINGVSYGVYASIFTGSTDIGKIKFREIDTQGAMIGGVAATNVGDYDVSGQIALGFSANDSDRVVGGGSANAKADYNSYFASPSMTVSQDFVYGTVKYSPSLTGGYTLTRTESYTEHGSLADQTIDAKTSHMLSGRALVEATPLPLLFGEQQSVLKHSYRAGLQAHAGIGDQSIDVSVLGTNVTIDPDADRTLDGIVGINLDYYDMKHGMNVYFDGEAALGINHGGLSDNMGGTAKVGLRWTF